MIGKVIAVTGGAGGIGLVTVKYLVSKGARVSVGDIDESKFESIMAHFRSEGSGEQVRVYKVDVGDSQSVNDWMHNTVEWAGQLDGAANIAGMSGPDLGKPLAETSDQHWDLVLKGMFNSVRSQLNSMKDGGSIVCISSVQGRLGFPGNAAYSAAKHGIIGLVRSTAKEVGGRNIRINTVAPGAIDTEMVRDDDRNNPLTPLKRIGTPEECAKLITFLLSDDSAFITGATYGIDGGWAC